MAKFLEVDLSDEMVESIAKAAGFDSMQSTYTGSTLKLMRKGKGAFSLLHCSVFLKQKIISLIFIQCKDFILAEHL